MVDGPFSGKIIRNHPDLPPLTTGCTKNEWLMLMCAKQGLDVFRCCSGAVVLMQKNNFLGEFVVFHQEIVVFRLV